MIEPKGTPVDVLGVPNRQSKVPMGAGQSARNPYGSTALDHAQDHPGYGTPGTQGFSDEVPGKTVKADCARPAQDAGSAAAGVTFSGGPINKGAANAEGKTAHDANSPEHRTKVNAPSTPGEGAAIFKGIYD